MPLPRHMEVTPYLEISRNDSTLRSLSNLLAMA